jgi:hypothetical protein
MPKIDKGKIAAELRSITKEEALADYAKLKDSPCPTRNEKTRAGLKALDYFFFRHRLNTKNQHHLTFYNALQDPSIVARLNEKIRTVRGKSIAELKAAGTLLKTQYSLFQLYYGAVNQFPPSIARYIYCKYKPRKAILDFSAGWGGRALAAISLGIPYIGIDTNRALKAGYEAMVKLYEPTAPVDAIRMFWQPSETVDFSKLDYDLVFTSPPYFMIEEYEGMKSYEGKKNFIESFFVPVVKSAYEHLPAGGVLALNMPVEMYEYVRGCLPRLSTKLTLPVSQRYAKKDNVKGKAILLDDATERFEYIYIWKKSRTGQTRKNQSKCGMIERKTRKG